jgi:hypothetical protein
MAGTTSTTTASERTRRCRAHDRREIPAAVDHGDPVPARAPYLAVGLVESLRDLLEHVELAQHAAGAIAKHSRRGWRIDKPNSRVHVDGVIALCMACDRQANQPAPAQLVGWI